MPFFNPPKISDDESIIAALNASQAVIEFTPKGQIIRANPNFLSSVGYTIEELTGQHHSLFCDKDYSESEGYRRFWRDLESGNFASGVFKRFGKGGRPLWLQATYNPIRDRTGRVIKVIKFASDITDAKAREIDTAGKINAIDRAQAVIEFTPRGEILNANEKLPQSHGLRA